jgi:hypothetical protein
MRSSTVCTTDAKISVVAVHPFFQSFLGPFVIIKVISSMCGLISGDNSKIMNKTKAMTSQALPKDHNHHPSKKTDTPIRPVSEMRASFGVKAVVILAAGEYECQIGFERTPTLVGEV